jgi:hypothetical protein
MIICRSKHAATESASLLRRWDGAFIKRSSGVWTYAVLIERALQPMAVLKKRLEYFYWATVWEVDPRDEMEDSMLFAIDGDGSTKIIPRHIWANYVRRIKRNPIPNIPRRISNPLPTEGTTKPSSQDDNDIQIIEASEYSKEYFKVLGQHHPNEKGRISKRTSSEDSGFDEKNVALDDSGRESEVYPC